MTYNPQPHAHDLIKAAHKDGPAPQEALRKFFWNSKPHPMAGQTVSLFDEQDHPRDARGRFQAKHQEISGMAAREKVKLSSRQLNAASVARLIEEDLDKYEKSMKKFREGKNKLTDNALFNFDLSAKNIGALVVDDVYNNGVHPVKALQIWHDWIRNAKTRIDDNGDIDGFSNESKHSLNDSPRRARKSDAAEDLNKASQEAHNGVYIDINGGAKSAPAPSLYSVLQKSQDESSRRRFAEGVATTAALGGGAAALASGVKQHLRNKEIRSGVKLLANQKRGIASGYARKARASAVYGQNLHRYADQSYDYGNKEGSAKLRGFANEAGRETAYHTGNARAARSEARRLLSAGKQASKFSFGEMARAGLKGAGRAAAFGAAAGATVAGAKYAYERYRKADGGDLGKKDNKRGTELSPNMIGGVAATGAALGGTLGTIGGLKREHNRRKGLGQEAKLWAKNKLHDHSASVGMARQSLRDSSHYRAESRKALDRGKYGASHALQDAADQSLTQAIWSAGSAEQMRSQTKAGIADYRTKMKFRPGAVVGRGMRGAAIGTVAGAGLGAVSYLKSRFNHRD